MILKRKKSLIKIILGFAYVIVVTITFIYWNIKNRILNDFAQIEFSIYKTIPDRKYDFDVHLTYCDTVIHFVKNNPIELDFYMNCNDHTLEKDSLLEKENRKLFIKQVEKIYNEYRRSERRANYLFYSILIIAPILLALIKNYINKKTPREKRITEKRND